MLVDEVTIHLKAGNGGRGTAAFSRVRLVKGPTGGDGGNGGDVYAEGVLDIGGLGLYAARKEMNAENGKIGGASLNDGTGGEDLILKIPLGTTITNTESGETFEVDKVGEKILLLKGGRGGRGNYKFRSSTNTTPLEYEEGKTGPEAKFSFKLRLIADVGLIGLPNAGKSSLLNELTSAKSRVANYPFTTLEAHLGSYFGVILADIPGLIEGASTGKGLGTKFLKHVERTRIFFHLVSAESDNPLRDYRIVRKELTEYDPKLAEKTEYVLLTKIDMISPKELQEKFAEFAKEKITVIPISILEPESMKEIQKILNGIKSEIMN